jgi:hypothetical protein
LIQKSRGSQKLKYGQCGEMSVCKWSPTNETACRSSEGNQQVETPCLSAAMNSSQHGCCQCVITVTDFESGGNMF